MVRGAKVKVMTKGKPVLPNRPVQKLYPLEVRTETLKPPVGAEQDDNKTGGGQWKGDSGRCPRGPTQACSLGCRVEV